MRRMRVQFTAASYVPRLAAPWRVRENGALSPAAAGELPAATMRASSAEAPILHPLPALGSQGAPGGTVLTAAAGVPGGTRPSRVRSIAWTNPPAPWPQRVTTLIASVKETSVG